MEMEGEARQYISRGLIMPSMDPNKVALSSTSFLTFERRSIGLIFQALSCCVEA